MRSRSIRLAAAALATLPVAALLSTASPAHAAEPVSPAAAALDWLSSELAAHDGMLTNSFGGDTAFPDHGLTIDAILAEVAGGHDDDPAVAEAVDAVDAALNAYLTQGAPVANDWGSKAAAKSLYLQGVLGTDLGGAAIDLEAALRSTMATDADADDPDFKQPGRFYDLNLSGWGEYGNGLGQAFAILGLEQTAGGVPAEAVDFLLSQQCPEGSFRLYYQGYITSYDPFETVADATCLDASEGDVDATALALDALLVLPSSPAVDAAKADAITFLQAAQASSGGFEGTGAINSNTTGLAAAALRAAGHTADADAAAGFVAGLQQLECTDFGALGYDQTAFDAGVDANREQWIRATTQGVLALGLPTYGTIGNAEPVAAGLDPVACPTKGSPGRAPSATASASSVVAGGSITITAAGFDAGEMVSATLHSTPVVLETVAADDSGGLVHTYAIPADLEPGQHSIVLAGQSSGTTVAVTFEVTAAPTDATALPATGSAVAAETAFALALLGIGVVLVTASRRRLALFPAHSVRRR